jgi:hypothetical protein
MSHLRLNSFFNFFRASRRLFLRHPDLPDPDYEQKGRIKFQSTPRHRIGGLNISMACVKAQLIGIGGLPHSLLLSDGNTSHY